MSRIVYAWELGGRLGHITTAAKIGLALKDQGHKFTALLSDLSAAEQFLAPHGIACWQAPLCQGSNPAAAFSYAEILCGAGYLDPRLLAGILRAWRNLFDTLSPDLLLADHAPTALLAARGRPFLKATIGTGFFHPPEQRPIPPFRTWEPVDPERLAHAEEKTLASINQALDLIGASPLESLHEIFAVDECFLTTWKTLDHYPDRVGGKYWGPVFVDQVGISPSWPRTTGKRIFAYLKADYAHVEKVLKAFRDSGQNTLVYLQGDNGHFGNRYRSATLSFINEPVRMESATDADLVVCHAGHSTVAAAILAGKPVMLLPMNAEQYLTTLRVESIGAGLGFAPELRRGNPQPMLEQLLSNPRFTVQSKHFAKAHAHYGSDTAATAIAKRCNELLIDYEDVKTNPEMCAELHIRHSFSGI